MTSGSVGTYADAAYDRDGNLHAVYRNGSTVKLNYIKRTGSTWGTVQAEPSSNSTGLFASIAIDSQEQAHISYHDSTTKDLKYSRYDGSWSTVTVDSVDQTLGLVVGLRGQTGGAHVALDVAGRFFVVSVLRNGFVSPGVTTVLFESSDCSGQPYLRTGSVFPLVSVRDGNKVFIERVDSLPTTLTLRSIEFGIFCSASTNVFEVLPLDFLTDLDTIFVGPFRVEQQ